MSDYENDAGTITMLEGGKVLFDESAGLQPVKLVEVPVGPKKQPANARIHDRR